jgi:peptidoglycan hydrolase CwlO-like protein
MHRDKLFVLLFNEPWAYIIYKFQIEVFRSLNKDLKTRQFKDCGTTGTNKRNFNEEIKSMLNSVQNVSSFRLLS